MKNFTTLPLIVFIILAFLLSVSSGADRVAKFFGAKENAPVFTTNIFSPNFEKISSDELGETYIINFFASWCGYCIREHPYLQTLVDKGAVLYGVAYKDDNTSIEQMLSSLGNPYKKVLLDPQGKLAKLFFVKAVPETIVVQNNKIVKRIRGEIGPAYDFPQDFMVDVQ